jgi:hypothetical protein
VIFRVLSDEFERAARRFESIKKQRCDIAIEGIHGRNAFSAFPHGGQIASLGVGGKNLHGNPFVCPHAILSIAYRLTAGE